MLPHRVLTIAAVVGVCMRANYAHADTELAPADDVSAQPLSASALLDEGYARKKQGDLVGAAEAFEGAREAGAEAQRVALELGYLAAIQGNSLGARRYFQEASLGNDSELRSLAAKELQALAPEPTPRSSSGAYPQSASTPRLAFLEATRNSMSPLATGGAARWWGDLYAEAYGWHRLQGPPLRDDLVPTLRLRALYRISSEPDINLYAVAQATRDLASKASDSSGLPIIYADNHATVGIGAMLRIWERQLGFFAQTGPTVSLVDRGEKRTRLDLRAGAFLGLESDLCAARPEKSELVAWPCAELYSEAVYVNRFDHNVIGFARGRAGFTYWATGPLLSQLLLEGRGAVDSNHDYYNNFADVGLGNRFRFVSPIRLDIMTGIHGGSYFGVSGRDPLPSTLRYVELRLQAATYLEF